MPSAANRAVHYRRFLLDDRAVQFAGYVLARPDEGNGVIGWVANVIEPRR
jgi:hypothetical protein